MLFQYSPRQSVMIMVGVASACGTYVAVAATGISVGIAVAVSMGGRGVLVATRTTVEAPDGIVPLEGTVVSVTSSGGTDNCRMVSEVETMLTGCPPWAVTDHCPGVAVSGTVLTNLKRPSASVGVDPRSMGEPAEASDGRSSRVTWTPAGQSAPTTVSASPLFAWSGATVI